MRSWEHAHFSLFVRQRWLCMLVLALIAMSGLTLVSFPAVQAAASNIPLITWDSTMIYPGQNGGNPWGPPGEQAFVHGQNFIAGQTLNLVLVAGNSNNTLLVCRGKAADVAKVTVASGGTFETNFIWPLALNQAGQQYSICALGPNSGVVSTHDAPGPFTVLTQSPPVISVSTTTVVAGNAITVTGANWAPDQQIDVDVTFLKSPGSVANALVNSGDGLQGTFSTTVNIPTGTPPGTYSVTAFSVRNSLLSTSYTKTNQNLTITAPIATTTPTVTVSPTPTATATPAASPTPTATPVLTSGNTGNNGNSTTPSGTDKNLIFILLITLAVVVLAIGGLLLFMLAHRKQNAPPSFGPGFPPQGGNFSPYPPGNNRNMAFSGVQFPPQVQGGICARCNSPLPPNSLICSSCGLHNGLPIDPDAPTLAY